MLNCKLEDREVKGEQDGRTGEESLATNSFPIFSSVDLHLQITSGAEGV